MKGKNFRWILQLGPHHLVWVLGFLAGVFLAVGNIQMAKFIATVLHRMVWVCGVGMMGYAIILFFRSH